MFNSAVILRARGAKGNLFVSSKGLDPVKVSQCVTELVERLNAYATAPNKEDIDGYGSFQPQLFDGSMVVDASRYVMYFRLLGQVWMLVLAPNNGRVYAYQQMRNTITQLIVHLCKSQDINVDKVKRNYLHIYYGILATQKLCNKGLQAVLDELDVQVSLVDPKIAAGKKAAAQSQDPSLFGQSISSQTTYGLRSVTLKQVTFSIPLKDDSFPKLPSFEDKAPPPLPDQSAEDPFFDLNLLDSNQPRRPPPPMSSPIMDDPFAAPPPAISPRKEAPNLLSISTEVPQLTGGAVQDPFAIGEAPASQQADPFALLPPVQIEPLTGPASTPIMESSPQLLDTDNRAQTIPTATVDPFATVSAPSKGSTIQSAAPATSTAPAGDFDPFAASQDVQESKSHSFSDLLFELCESWKGEVRGANVSKAALMGIININVVSDVAKGLPTDSIKLVVPENVQLKNMALNPEIGKKTGDKVITLNSDYQLDKNKTAAMFKYLSPLSPAAEAPVLIRLITKKLPNEKQLMVGVQYNCNPNYSDTKFNMLATLKVGSQIGKPPLRVAPQAVFDARGGELKWKLDTLQDQGILKASFSVEGVADVDSIMKGLMASVALEAEAKSSYTEVKLVETKESEKINLKFKKKFEMELFTF
eukprot:TRINITY_DN3972_c1_g1_i5.p1 TRINITY_DN3972_c1_g1~~TRINITY_DN3972_c1_g1_i5.p1  ORF type:complete len:643 (+),score=80.18 TRINITY_DN3972_c1_g1_i5:118-2046(+)